jgi:hypothetical protein
MQKSAYFEFVLRDSKVKLPLFSTTSLSSFPRFCVFLADLGFAHSWRAAFERPELWQPGRGAERVNH